MERDERNREYDQPAQDIHRRLVAFWGNQLQRLKRRTEGQANGTSTSSTYDGKFRIEPGCGSGH
jgi:hypothetical protein